MSVTSPNTRWMTPPPVYDTRSAAQSSSTTLKPYLQLPHLLSLTWLAYPILSLLFVAFRLQLSIDSSQDAVSVAKGDLLTSCTAAEQAATAAASMPRYMAAATNQQFADAVNGTMDGARAALVLSLTVMEAIINFMVDIYRSTFLCFLELVVRGGLALLISAVQEITTAVQGTMNSIRTSIQNDVSSANSAIQSAVSGINKLKVFGNVSVPQFSIPSLSALQNVTIPTDFENALIQLNNSLPTLSELKSAVDAIIDTPFEAVKADINNTFAGLNFNASILPVPPQNTLSFCGDLDTSVIDDLGNDLLKVAKIGTLIIVALALLLLAGNCLLEWYKWRCLQRHLEYTRQAWTSDPTMYHSGPAHATPTVTLSNHNLLMLQANGAHPLLTRIANTLAERLRLSPSQHTHLQWFFHYVFHPPALACFLIGFFGLLSVQLQLLAVGPLEAKYTAQAAASVADFSNTIATSMNASMYNQSSVYANDINGRVNTVQQTINDGVFGWVNGTTTTLNNTLNTFYDDVQNAVSTVFNGTILESPVQEFIKCIIGSKVDAFEEALTFLHNNLQVNMPLVNESVLVLSPADVNEATQPIAAAAIGGGSGDSQGLVGRLVATYVNSLKKERIMFSIFMGLWGIVVLMALCIIFWHSYGQHWMEAHKKRKWQREQREGIDTITSFRSGHDDAIEKGDTEKAEMDLPSFTPMPSPKPGMHLNPFSRPVPNSTSPAPPNHPLNSLDPKFEKSWDSFLDHNAASQDSATSKNRISKPTKLMAIGRKAMGRERFVGDAEKPDESDEEEDRGGNRWFGKMTGKLWKKDGSTEGDTENRGRSSFQVRRRPDLTISTARASEIRPDNPSGRESASRDLEPSSAWSVSPTPPRMPWMNVISSTKNLKAPHPPGLPLTPKPRRNVNVPTDVNSVYDDTSLLIQKPVQSTPLAVPLHFGFERRVPPQAPRSISPPPSSRRATLAPPPDRHRRSSSVPAPAWEANQAGANESTPVTRFLTTTHARHSSMAVDPFATPFDDDARVATKPGKPRASVRQSHIMNPFAAIAF